MNLLKHVDVDARRLLIDHASKLGARSAFADDAFTSRKMLPGFKPRLTSAKWIRWQTVTHDSFKLLIKNVISRHEATSEQAHLRAPKASLRKTSGLSTLVWGIKDHVCAMYPSISEQDRPDNFIKVYIDGDPNLFMGVEGASKDDTARFDLMELPVLNTYNLTVPDCKL